MSPENGPAAQVTQPAMGTVMTHRASGRRAEECLAAVCREVARLEGLLSRYLPGSEINQVNRSAGKAGERVSRETFELLSKAVEFSESFPGCFDVTIGPLVALWRAARETSAPPDAARIGQLLPLVNHRDLVLNSRQRTAGLRKAGQSIDLGGIGKGFAGDRIVDLYKRFGVSSACSNLGGNVVTVGAKPDGSPWHIGIQHPRQEDQVLGSVSVIGQTVVTSGDYQRYFTDGQGKRHHHILHPQTGFPAESGLVSVSVVSDRSVEADALSTILFVAGREKGLAWLRAALQTGAILVDSDLRVYVTRGLKDRFQAAEGVRLTILD